MSIKPSVTAQAPVHGKYYHNKNLQQYDICIVPLKFKKNDKQNKKNIKKYT